MEEAKKTFSVAQLAREAEKMPWEDRAPLFARLAFQQAITPELFMELLAALQDCLPLLRAMPAHDGLIEKVERAIEGATGVPA